MEYQGIFTTKGITTKEDGSADYTISIITTIVDQSYSGFNNGDTTTINVPSIMTKTGEQIYTELTVATNAFVAQKYPNT